MGRFKSPYKHNSIYSWLVQQGYEDKTGAKGEEGYTNVYKINDLYYVWVTINLDEKKIYIYQEYNCGGCVGTDEINIDEEWLEDLDVFIDEVDQALEDWIG